MTLKPLRLKMLPLSKLDEPQKILFKQNVDMASRLPDLRNLSAGTRLPRDASYINMEQVKKQTPTRCIHPLRKMHSERLPYSHGIRD